MPTLEDRLRQIELSNRKLQREMDLVRRIGYVEATTNGDGGTYVPVSRTIFTSGGLTGGASLRDDISLSVNRGSGLNIDSAGKLILDSAVFGEGLQWNAGTFTVSVGEGAGILVSGSTVSLNSTLAGQGLNWNVDKVDVVPGDGITTNNDAVSVANGQGLTFSNELLTINSGNGLEFTGGGVTPQILSVKEGTLISVDENGVNLESGDAINQVIVTGTGNVPAYKSLSSLAGEGLGFSSNQFTVNGGVLITVSGDAVNLKNGNAKYQIPVTGVNSPFTPAYQSLTSLIGNGLSFDDSTGKLFLDLPSTLHINSTNSVTTDSHTHAITSSFNVIPTFPSNPSAPATDNILKTSGGKLTLRNLDVGDLFRTNFDEKFIGINRVGSGTSLDVIAANPEHNTVRIKQLDGQQNSPNNARLLKIESRTGSELIVLDGAGNLQSGSPQFVSGLTGWRITPTGNAEFNNGTFRGELRASVFAIEEIHASPGTLIVSRSAGKLKEDVTLVNTGVVADLQIRSNYDGEPTHDFLDLRTTSTDGTGPYLSVRSIRNIIQMDNPESGRAILFYKNEILQVKAFTGSAVQSIWMKVNNNIDYTTHYGYYVQIMSGTLPATFRAGTAIVAHGLPGKGAIKLSADGQYTPNLDIYTIGEKPWGSDEYPPDIFPHVRLGQLEGLGVVTGEQYGIALGENLAESNTPRLVASNLGVSMYSIDSTWTNGDTPSVRIESNGRARFGSNVNSSATTFLDINPATATAKFNGEIQATTGLIGGFTIGATKLTAGTTNATSVGISTGADTSDIAFFAGHLTPTSAPFYVTQAGALFASNATISGNITATTGLIGGFTIGATKLTAGSVGVSTGADTNSWAFWAGDTNPQDAEFRVDTSGALTATSGSIGGFSLSSSSLTAGSNENGIGISTGSIAFWAGNTTASNAEFKVTQAGALTATGATISGAITATSGSFTGNITINGGTLTTSKAGVTDKTYLNSDGFFIYSAGNSIGGINNSINWTAPVDETEIRSAYISYRQNTSLDVTTGTMRLQAGTNANKPAILTLNYNSEANGIPSIESNTNFTIRNISTSTSESTSTTLRLQGWRIGNVPFSKIEFYNSTSSSAEIITTKELSGAEPTTMKLLVSDGSNLIEALNIDTQSGAGKVQTGTMNATIRYQRNSIAGSIFVPLETPIYLKGYISTNPNDVVTWNNIELSGVSTNIEQPSIYFFNFVNATFNNIPDARAVVIYLSMQWGSNNASQKAAVAVHSTNSYLEAEGKTCKVVGFMESLTGNRPTHGHFTVPLSSYRFNVLVTTRNVNENPEKITNVTCRLAGYYL